MDDSIVVAAATTNSNNERCMRRTEALGALRPTPGSVLHGNAFEPFIIFPPLCIAVVTNWHPTAASVAVCGHPFCKTTLNLTRTHSSQEMFLRGRNKQGRCHRQTPACVRKRKLREMLEYRAATQAPLRFAVRA